MTYENVEAYLTQFPKIFVALLLTFFKKKKIQGLKILFFIDVGEKRTEIKMAKNVEMNALGNSSTSF